MTSFLPAIYLQSSFWTTSPTWFVIRVGLLMASLAALFALSRLAARIGITWAPLARFGASSLFVYWIHVELVYGYATWSIHHRLPLWGTFIAWSVFTSLMYAAITLEEQLVIRIRRMRRATVQAPAV